MFRFRGEGSRQLTKQDIVDIARALGENVDDKWKVSELRFIIAAHFNGTTPVALARKSAISSLQRFDDLKSGTFNAQLAEINNDPEAPCGRCEACAICPAHDKGAR